jgi:hypothetical protein
VDKYIADGSAISKVAVIFDSTYGLLYGLKFLSSNGSLLLEGGYDYSF